MRAGDDREGVRADGEQPDVTDRELSAEADHEVQPRDQDPVRADQRREVELVLVTRPERQRDEGSRGDGKGEETLH